VFLSFLVNISSDLCVYEQAIRRQNLLFAGKWLELQSQSLELVSIVTVINVVIGGFSGEDLRWLTHVLAVRLQLWDYSQLSDYTVRWQLCRLITAKYSSLCTNHIWGTCNCYDYDDNRFTSSFRSVSASSLYHTSEKCFSLVTNCNFFQIRLVWFNTKSCYLHLPFRKRNLNGAQNCKVRCRVLKCLWK